MQDVQIFNNPDFGEIRTVVIDGEPWFVGNDCAKALGFKDPYSGIRKNVDDEDKTTCPVGSGADLRNMNVINESGLYALIFGSKLESAKKFKKWVTSEVLPSIRKTGSYGIPKDTDGKIALLAQGHSELRADINRIEGEVEALKNDLPLLPVEADLITTAVKAKGVSVIGGKESAAYRSRSTVTAVYKDIYSQIYRNFGISTYKAIKRSQCATALEIIGKYELPVILRERIDAENAQQSLLLEGGAL